MEKRRLLHLNLKLFEGEGAGMGDGGSDAGNEGESLSKVVYGKAAADDSADEAKAKKSAFEKLTKGEYKNEFNERVQNIVKSRLADERKAASAKNAPLMELLAQKYGVDAKSETLNDDLIAAINDDRSFWERGAMERGLTVDQYKHQIKLEQENAQFREMARQAENQEKVNRLMEEAEMLKDYYPDFDFDAEMQNEDLMNLLRSNIDLKTAYEVIHHDEIMEGAMRYTANVIQQKTVNDIRARGLRPTENGVGSNTSATYKANVNDLTGADIDEIIKRVGKGEKISF